VQQDRGRAGREVRGQGKLLRRVEVQLQRTSKNSRVSATETWEIKSEQLFGE
jgi:hypothetical protein